MMAWVVAVEGLVLIKKITFRDKAAVDVAAFQVNGCLSFMLDMPNFLSSPRAKGSMKDQKLAMAENHPTTLES